MDKISSYENSHSCAQVEEPCSWEFVIDSTKEMLIWSSHGNLKPWWSLIKGLPSYWGIQDLCGAYCWWQQTLSEFWNYSPLSRTWCLSKLKSDHHKTRGWIHPCNILVRKTKNGDNIVVHSCIPLGNIRDRVQHMWDRQISWDFNNDEIRSVLGRVLP